MRYIQVGSVSGFKGNWPRVANSTIFGGTSWDAVLPKKKPEENREIQSVHRAVGEAVEKKVLWFGRLL